jgi:hypothetical protein
MIISTSYDTFFIIHFWFYHFLRADTVIVAVSPAVDCGVLVAAFAGLILIARVIQKRNLLWYTIKKMIFQRAGIDSKSGG